MAFTEGGNEGILTGTTPIEVVPAPGAGEKRIVKNVHFFNEDSASVTVVVSKKKGATNFDIAHIPLTTKTQGTLDKIIVLDATDESITARLLAAPASVNPTFDTAFGTNG